MTNVFEVGEAVITAVAGVTGVARLHASSDSVIDFVDVTGDGRAFLNPAKLQ